VRGVAVTRVAATTICYTAASQSPGGRAMLTRERTPEIMGDSAYGHPHKAVARVHRAVRIDDNLSMPAQCVISTAIASSRSVPLAFGLLPCLTDDVPPPAVTVCPLR